MKPIEHINIMLEQCYKLQEEGHCAGDKALFVRISDVEIKINDLKEAFEHKGEIIDCGNGCQIEMPDVPGMNEK